MKTNRRRLGKGEKGDEEEEEGRMEVKPENVQPAREAKGGLEDRIKRCGLCWTTAALLPPTG